MAPDQSEGRKVVQLHDIDPRVSGLQRGLRDLIYSDRFIGMNVAAVVGVLEFMKQEVINGA